MSPVFLAHLQQQWPLAVIATGLLVYIPITLIKGVFYTNQGRIFRSTDSARYWKWVFSFMALDLACVAVLLGSFLLSRQ
jgi:hypothetical protein